MKRYDLPVTFNCISSVQYTSYSLKTLNDSIASLDLIKLGISEVSLDEENNIIRIVVPKVTQELKDNISQYIDLSLVEFEERELNLSFTTSVNPGSGVDVFREQTYIGSGTISFIKCGGNLDIAFVNRTLADILAGKYLGETQTEIPYYQLNSFSVVQNLAVLAHSSISGGQFSKILSLNKSYVVNGISFSGMAKADYKAISGAPVYRPGAYGGLSPVDPGAIGIQSASLLASDGSWLPGTSYTYFSKLSNIGSVSISLLDF